MCSIRMKAHKKHGLGAEPHALAKLRTLTRRFLQRLFAVQSSVRVDEEAKASTDEIAENEANERLQAAATAPPHVLCLETTVGCFFWEHHALKSSPATDLDWCRALSCSFYPAMQQFH